MLITNLPKDRMELYYYGDGYVRVRYGGPLGPLRSRILELEMVLDLLSELLQCYKIKKIKKMGLALHKLRSKIFEIPPFFLFLAILSVVSELVFRFRSLGDSSPFQASLDKFLLDLD